MSETGILQQTGHQVRYGARGMAGCRILVCESCSTPGGFAYVMDQPAISRARFFQQASEFLQVHPPVNGMVPCEQQGVPTFNLQQMLDWLR